MDDWKRSGIKPPALENQPEIAGHLLVYYDLYNRLKHYRTWSDGLPNPIMLSDIQDYAKRYGYDSTIDDLERFEDMIQACDQSFISYHVEQRAKEVAAAKAKAKTK